MNRHQLEHLIRAAATIADTLDIVILGSQAILGQHPDAPPSLLRSMKADVYPLHAPDLAELIDGSIGEGSPFHTTFGYYAQGVGPETAMLAPGWSERLVPISNEATRGATGWCLDTHDLVLSKLVAGRPKDLEFAAEARRAGLLDLDELRRRASQLAVEDRLRTAVASRIAVLERGE
ncbi:MAG: hypothetical protein GC161_19475 [Planctomycetaceae bacterium]|nr:hypothetical protein [Planctomycetaceae bacterium]